MSDTPAADSPADGAKKRGGLSTMLVADLKAMAGALGIDGAESMKKPQLVAAIRGAGSPVGSSAAATPPPAPAAAAPADEPSPPQVTRRTRQTRTKPDRQPDAEPAAAAPAAEPTPAEPTGGAAPEAAPAAEEQTGRSRSRSRARGEDQSSDAGQDVAEQAREESRPEPARDTRQEPKQDTQGQGNQSGQGNQGNQGGQGNQGNQAGQGQADAEGEGEGRRNRRRRGRDRNRTDQPAQGGQGNQNGQGNQGNQGNQGGQGGQSGQGAGGTQGGQQGQQGKQDQGKQDQPRHQREPDTTILEDDVLVPAAGILDVLDNYAFVRTSGYLPGADDVYVSLSMVRKYGLRRGDALMGQVRQPREGERKEKFNPMVRIDLVNGTDPEGAKQRPDFAALTAVHPTERLRLETDAGGLLGRVVDVIAPLGKGQRALVVSPARAGKTATITAVAGAVTAGNPECHLMVVLVDQRPEEVTDLERSVKGEVIASTFDRPGSDHTVLAELAMERAKRLVELGHDVVVLLDGLTRLGRAYAVAAQAHGRGPAPLVEVAAVHPVKRFFGAARDVEDGGSLTVLATAQVDSGSPADDVLLEELAGAANSVLRLRREAADAGLFPAVDPLASGTAHEDLLLGEQELTIVRRLRRTLAAKTDPEAALQLLLEQLASTQTNIELLTRVQRG